MKRRHFLASGMASALPFFPAHAQGVSKTVAYGTQPSQAVDIYLPKGDCYAWILMVHGGGWRRGDKSSSRVVANKVARWNAKGVAVVSMNYRLLPEAAIEQQVQDVRSAISFLQRKANTLGLLGPMVLMGHSSGAHLVAMVSSQMRVTRDEGIAPWAGTVLLDSAALNVPMLMEKQPVLLYKRAFGADPQRWTQLSPVHQVQVGMVPVLVVYSENRQDGGDIQAQMYAQRLSGFGVRNVQLLGVRLSHGQINESLGLDNDYTLAVESFMAGLHPALESIFKR